MSQQQPTLSISPEEPKDPINPALAGSGRDPRSAVRGGGNCLQRVRGGGNCLQRIRGQGDWRAGLAVIAGKVAGLLSRRLHLGGGTSIAGLVAQKVDPRIIHHLAGQLEHGCMTITGTNGKTTTSGFTAAILRESGLRVWHNREGSNLMGGIASLLIAQAQPNGHLERGGEAIAILEIDEATIPRVIHDLEPRVAVFTNLFRDQLDRYGEVDSIITHWEKSIRELPASTILVLNADDPAIAHLGDGFAGKIVYYGVDDPSLDLEHQGEHHQVSDARACPKCGHHYSYNLRFYSHIGHYHCANCGLRRPQPDVRVTHVEADGFDRYRITVEYTATETAQENPSADANATVQETQFGDSLVGTSAGAQTPGRMAWGVPERQEIIVPLPGLYNIYNALAAVTATKAINVGWEPISSGIGQYKPAFGRGELIPAEGRMIRLLLAKNPTGFNEVLRTLFSEGIARHVLFILNDGIADGQDVSWIWDVDFERARGLTSSLVISGTRALDLAIRLKYADIPQEEMKIVPQTEQLNTSLAESYGLKSALDLALQQTPIGETLFVVPTYTGLLAIHRELTQRGLTSHYWETETGA